LITSQDLCGRTGTEGDAGCEFGGMAVGIKACVLPEQLVEHAPLVVGDDLVADARQSHGLSVG
jgi:hypothetical protein